MHAAVLHNLGTRPRCEEFAEPVATENEALVHVHAASLKPVDKQIANGSHYATPRKLPFICGTDGVGHLEDGRRVFFTTGVLGPDHDTKAYLVENNGKPQEIKLKLPE